MNRKIPGVIAMCLLVASVLTGLYGIFLISGTAAVIYLAGFIVVWLVFIYAFCTKCPVHDQCIHVVNGCLAGLMPQRLPEAYTRGELLAVALFFGFTVLFPLSWLAGKPILLILFIVFFAGNLLLTHFTCCRGCGNRSCMLRYG